MQHFIIQDAFDPSNILLSYRRFPKLIKLRSKVFPRVAIPKVFNELYILPVIWEQYSEELITSLKVIVGAVISAVDHENCFHVNHLISFAIWAKLSY